MKLSVKDIFEVIDLIPEKERARWKRIYFCIDEGTLALDNGKYIAGEWGNSGVITLYPFMIANKKELRKTIMHEIAHHLGLDHHNMPSNLL